MLSRDDKKRGTPDPINYIGELVFILSSQSVHFLCEAAAAVVVLARSHHLSVFSTKDQETPIRSREYVLSQLGNDPQEPSKMNGLELTGPIVGKNSAKRIAYGAVLVPGEPDHDGEILSPERIEQAAHEWMYGYRNVDYQHTLNKVGIPVESYILPVPWTVSVKGQPVDLPVGTWILATKVPDEDVWNEITSGKLTGYSIMGVRRHTAAGKSREDDSALKRTLLQDLGEDWICPAVSFVDEPAVPKAKLFALKQKPSTWEKFLDFLRKEKAEVVPEEDEDESMTDEDPKKTTDTVADEAHEDQTEYVTAEDFQAMREEFTALSKEVGETLGSLRSLIEEEIKSLKSSQAEFQEGLVEKLKKRASSRTLDTSEKGQEETPDRDVFGRKVRK